MAALTVLTFIAIGLLAFITYSFSSRIRSPLGSDIVPVSVNYFFTRHCNAECGFCFHTETSSYKLPLPEAEKGLRLLAQAGMKKINFAGGEPFLYPAYLGSLCRFCKETLKLESVSIISNGTKVTEKWLRNHADFVDIMAVSCDSINPATNAAIGRADRGSKVPFDNVGQLFLIKEWCDKYGIRFKLNTVVCSLNWHEDMAEMVERLDPFRWKVFQVLVVTGENEHDERKRNATKFIVSDEQFDDFSQRHKHLKCMIPEPNRVMKSSYLLVDEYMRFLDKGGDIVEKVSQSILDVGVQQAIKQVRWDQETFGERGGVYDWSSVNQKQQGCGGGIGDSKLDW